MSSGPRIVIADRSELAGNLYRLLLAPLEPHFVIRRHFEEARPHFFRREVVDLGIFNSNIFGKKFDEIVARILDAGPLRDARKIFLCRPSPTEQPWRIRLEGLSHALVVTRPFHPDAFLETVRRMLAEGR